MRFRVFGAIVECPGGYNLEQSEIWAKGYVDGQVAFEKRLREIRMEEEKSKHDQREVIAG